MRNTVLSAFDYVQRGVANTFTALQTFNNGIRVSGQSNVGDICGNIFQNHVILNLTTAIVSGASTSTSNPYFIPAQTAMSVFVIWNQNLPGVVRMTPPPDPVKYIGQTYTFISPLTSADGQIMPGVGHSISGGNLSYSNSSTAFKIPSRAMSRLIYFGLFNASAPTWFFEQS